MRRFTMLVTNDEDFGRRGRLIRVRANTIRGAMRRALRKMKPYEWFEQVETRVRGCELKQPVWDSYNGNMSHHFGLSL